MVIKHRWQVSTGLRSALAVTAVAVVIVGGVKVTSDHTTPGSGFSTIATGAADPTGPTGGPDPGGMNGGQFQPPGLPPQQPDYQGRINQPPLDQNGGISIYNTGAQGAPQQAAGQQGGQQPEGQQPLHGTQIPDYQTATPYTEGPGKANPDYQAPQQGNQGQQPQQGNQQPQSQAPTQQPTQTVPTETQAPTQTPTPSPTQTQSPDQNKQEKDDDTQHENDDDRSDKCPGNVSPLWANENVILNETKPIVIKDYSPFAQLSDDVNDAFGQDELTYQFDKSVSAPFREAFNEAAKRWNDAQKAIPENKRIDVHEVGPTGFFDVVGPSLKIFERDGDPPILPSGDMSPANRSKGQIEYWPKGFVGETKEKIVGALVHEIGHALGLAHSCKGATMYYQMGMWQETTPTPFDVKMLTLLPR